MRRIAARRSRVLGARVLLWVASLASSSHASSWEHVVRATERLKAGDYAGATQALDLVPSGDVAEPDARLVRQALERALAPRLTSMASVARDNQPFDAAALAVTLSGWCSPRVQLRARAQTLTLRGTQRLSAELGGGGATLRLGAADVDLSADVVGRFWSDDARWLLGRLDGQLFPLRRVRVRAGVERADEIANYAAAAAHVMRDAAHLELSLHDLHHVDMAARAEASRFSDDNSAWLAYGWATYALLWGPLRVQAGYGAAYRDTGQSRWRAATGYFPYFTPLDAARHGPVAAVTLGLPRFELGVGGGGALMASERDPTTVGFFESRRTTSYYEARAHARFGGDEAWVQAAYELLHDGDYYDLHTFRLTAELAL